MNPFATPDRIVVLTRPQDMRAGINRLSAIVAAELGEDPMSGDLNALGLAPFDRARLGARGSVGARRPCLCAQPRYA